MRQIFKITLIQVNVWTPSKESLQGKKLKNLLRKNEKVDGCFNREGKKNNKKGLHR